MKKEINRNAINRVAVALFIILSCDIYSAIAADNHPEIYQATQNYIPCPTINENRYEYFGTSNTKDIRIFLEVWHQNLIYIRDNSQVMYGYEETIGENCKAPVNWVFPSNVSPGNNIRVTALENDRNCTLTRNNNPTKPIGQFSFRLSYAEATGFISPVEVGSYSYWQEKGTPGVAIRINNQNKRIWSPTREESQIFLEKSCLKIFARWCGDNIVSDGETCDDGDQNGLNGKCNVTCSTKD